MPFGQGTKKYDTPKKEFPRADNKVKVPNATRLGTIVDAWIYNVREQETGFGFKKKVYCGDPTDDQECKLTIAIKKRPDILLEKKMGVWIHEKAHFAKLIHSLLGVSPGQPLKDFLQPAEAFDVRDATRVLKDSLVGQDVMFTTERNAKDTWTNVTEVKPPLQDDDEDLAEIPLQTNPKLQKQPLTEAQKKSEQFDDSSIREDFIGQREPKVVGGDKRFPFKQLAGEKLSGSIFDEFDTGEPAPPNPEPAYAQGLENEIPF